MALAFRVMRMTGQTEQPTYNLNNRTAYLTRLFETQGLRDQKDEVINTLNGQAPALSEMMMLDVLLAKAMGYFHIAPQEGESSEKYDQRKSAGAKRARGILDNFAALYGGLEREMSGAEFPDDLRIEALHGRQVAFSALVSSKMNNLRYNSRQLNIALAEYGFPESQIMMVDGNIVGLPGQTAKSGDGRPDPKPKNISYI